MPESLALHEQLLSALYNAAAVLVAAVTDPVAIEQAPLKHRASALNAVSTLFSRLQKLSTAPASDTYQDIEFVFDNPDEEDGMPAGAPAFDIDSLAEYGSPGSAAFETEQITRSTPIASAPAPVTVAPIPSDHAAYHPVATNALHLRHVQSMPSLLDYDRSPA